MDNILRPVLKHESQDVLCSHEHYMLKKMQKI